MPRRCGNLGLQASFSHRFTLGGVFLMWVYSLHWEESIAKVFRYFPRRIGIWMGWSCICAKTNTFSVADQIVFMKGGCSPERMSTETAGCKVSQISCKHAIYTLVSFPNWLRRVGRRTWLAVLMICFSVLLLCWWFVHILVFLGMILEGASHLPKAANDMKAKGRHRLP